MTKVNSRKIEMDFRTSKTKIREDQITRISVFNFVNSKQVFSKSYHSHCEEKDNCLQYWKIFLNVAFLSCYTPIRLVWNSDTGTYRTKINHLHLPIYIILSIVGHISIVCNMIMKLHNLTEAATVAPIFYFDFTSLLSAVVYLSYSRYILACKKRKIESIGQQVLWILNTMPKPEKPKFLGIPITIRVKYKAIMLHSVLLVKIFLAVVIDLEQNGWGFNSWWGLQEERFRATFRVTSTYHPIFQWWYGITHIYNSLSFGLGDFFILTVGLIYFDVVTCFRESLKEKNSDFQQVMDNYKIIKKLTADISDITGVYIFAYTVSVVSFYITHLLEIFEPTATPSRLLYLLQTTYFMAIFYFIAAGNNMMKSFQHWLCEQENYRNDKMAVKDLHVILYDLVHNPVAVSAPGIFTVTFNLLGKLAGIVLTYTIVAMQFRTSVIK